jgi:peptide/nickel transport system substrate-binding protein
MRSKIVASEAVEVNGDLKNGPTIGTGPWIVDNWVKDETLTLRRNPNYFRQGLPHADTVERLIVLDPQTAQAAFRTGQVSNIGTNGQITRLLQQGVPDLQVVDAKLISSQSLRAILASPAVAPLNDKRVRQAVSKLLDREAIIRDVVFGSGWLNAGIFVPSLDWQLPDSELQKYLGRDVQMARQLLSAAGVDVNNWQPVLDVGIPGTDFTPAAELFVSNLKEAGINIADTKLLDKVEVTERAWGRGETEICACNTRPGGGGTNGILYTWFHSTGTDAGVFEQLGDREIDRMIEEQAVILDAPERRKSLLQEIMRRHLDQAVHNPIHSRNGELALAPSVGGYKHNNSEPHRYAEMWVKA